MLDGVPLWVYSQYIWVTRPKKNLLFFLGYTQDILQKPIVAQQS